MQARVTAVAYHAPASRAAQEGNVHAQGAGNRTCVRNQLPQMSSQAESQKPPANEAAGVQCFSCLGSTERAAGAACLAAERTCVKI